jgi:DNA-binding PadR family transcriptional regulator
MVFANETPRLSGKEMVVLDLLIGRGEMYGLQLVEVSGGHLVRGTVYVTLSRMEAKGYVESEEEAPDPRRSGIPRRRYRATGYGRRVFQAWQILRSVPRHVEVVV